MALVELNAIVGSATDDLEQVTETTALVVINTEDVREFYPRRHGKQGTRIVFKNSAGCPVADLYETVKARIAHASGLVIEAAPAAPPRAPALHVVPASEPEAETLN